MKRNRLTCILVLVCAVVIVSLFVGCDDSIDPLLSNDSGVVLAGASDGTAFWWKGGVFHSLGTEGKSLVSGMTKSDGYYYFAGKDDHRPCYWKVNATTGNSELILLDDTREPGTEHNDNGFTVSAILVSGGHVYCAGSAPLRYTVSRAIYWIDGVQKYLEDSVPGLQQVTANRIFEDEDRIYFGGVCFNPSTHRYWSVLKSDAGSANPTITSTACQNSDVTSNESVALYLDGSDIYVGGSNPDSIATYWKNNNTEPVTLSTPLGKYSTLFDISVEDGTVVACGFYYEVLDCHPCWWEGGTLHDLGGDGAALCMAKSGSVRYFAGTNNDKAAYWENGTLVQVDSIPGEESEVRCIWVD